MMSGRPVALKGDRSLRAMQTWTLCSFCLAESDANTAARAGGNQRKHEFDRLFDEVCGSGPPNQL